MLVYRIESGDGQGIYSAGFGHRFTRAAMMGNSTDLIHPSPEEEAELRVFWLGLKLSRSKRIDWELRGRREWFCGFESMERLLEWWSPEGLQLMWRTMLKHGKTARLVTYKINANQVKRGGKQLVFNKAKAEVVSIQPLERFVP
jgi:hypothetical protein